MSFCAFLKRVLASVISALFVLVVLGCFLGLELKAFGGSVQSCVDLCLIVPICAEL